MSRTRVVISVDVECSIGGAFADPSLDPVGPERTIYGRIGDQEYGIPLIADLLERAGLRGTFFVEAFASDFFGEEPFEEVCRYLIDRGHDVQLHLHPCWCYFKKREGRFSNRRFSDRLSEYTLAEKTELIREGKERLLRWTGQAPVAFRAGNYFADNEVLQALAANGLLMDSSYNLAHPVTRPDPGGLINDCTPLQEIWELPVTSFIDFRLGKRRRFKPLEINGVSFIEMKRALLQLVDQQIRTVVFNIHPFNLFKPGNSQYTRMKPNRMVSKRFSRLCTFLGQQGGDLEVCTFADLGKILGNPGNAPAPAPVFFPYPGLIPMLSRKAIQAWNRFH